MPHIEHPNIVTDWIPGASVLRRSDAIPSITNIIEKINILHPDIDYGVIRLTALEGFTRNLAGNPITGYDLGGVDSVFSNVVAYLYPNGASDDNHIQWECPVPQDMDLSNPEITVILHFLIPEPPYTAAPIPGGLPVGCEDSIIIYRSSSWVARKLVFDASGDLVSSSGEPVTVPC